MSSSGGKAVQITKGVGPDIGVRASSDGRTILYLQQQPAGHIWLGDLERGTAHEITHDDIVVNDLSLSPDHSTIAAVIRDPDPIRPISNIWLLNRDGGGRRRITTGEEWITAAQWSPSGNRLAYVARPASSIGDTLTAFVMNPAAPAARQAVFKGIHAYGLSWIDEMTLVVIDDLRSRIVPISGGDPISVSPESTWVFPSCTQPWWFCYDVRRSHFGIWLTTADAAGQNAVGRRLLDPGYNYLAEPQGGHYALFWKETGKVVKVTIPEGKLEPLPGFFPGLTPGTRTSASPDAKEFAYRQPTTSSKLVLIESLH
jgi:hypothetical protein